MKIATFLFIWFILPNQSYGQKEFIDVIVNHKRIIPDSGLYINQLETFVINVANKSKLFETPAKCVSVELTLAHGSRAVSWIYISNYEDLIFFDFVKLIKNKGIAGGRLIMQFTPNCTPDDEVDTNEGVVIVVPFLEFKITR